MPLGTDLGAHLDIGGPVGALVAVLNGSGGDLGAIIPPLDPAARDGAAGAASGLSLDGLGAAAGRLSGAIGPLLEQIPGANNALPAIESAIALLEQIAAPSLAQGITGLIGGLDATLEAERGGVLGRILRILEVIRAAPEATLLRDLATRIEGFLGGGVPLSGEAFAGFAEVIPAITGAMAALGALARLDATLEEAQRLSGVASTQLDAGTISSLLAGITARLGTGPTSLAGFISGLDPSDAAAVETAARELETISGRVGALASSLRDGMAFGEATLVHLDLNGLRQAIDTIRADVRGADIAPLERTLAALGGRLSGVFSFDVSVAPVRSLDQLLNDIETQIETFAAGIGGIDVTALLGPVGEGLARVTGLPCQLANTLESVAADIESALDTVRNGVRALPLDDVSGQLRQIAAAIAGVIGVLTNIIGGVETAIRDAANAGETVLRTAEDGLDTFKGAVDGAFGAARQAVEQADIDGITAEIDVNIHAFLSVVAQADMTPFFNTATGAIGTAAAVVEKVPFDLLPDSMEQEVVDAIRPVKQVDADGARTQIEVTLEIQDGHFNLRPAIEAAVADLKTQVNALIAQIKALDPEVLAAPLQAPIDSFRTKVASISLDVELTPLREALDTAKHAVAALDPTALLHPIDQAFDELLAGIDRFSPAQLIAPLDDRLDQAREAFIGLIGLRTWRDQLDGIEARATEMSALLDISSLERDITVALRAFQSQLANNPALGFLDSLLAALGPLLGGIGSRDAFARVAGWVSGRADAAAQLDARARALRDSVESTATAVAAADPAALATQLQSQLSTLAAAIATQPPGPARARLETSFTIDGPLGELTAMQTPWRRYRDTLTAASQATRDLGAEGFSEAASAAARIAAAASPFAALGRLARDILRPMGITRLDRGLSGVMEDLLEAAPPRRLARLATPMLAALKGRIDALVGAIIAPLRTAIDDLIRVVDVFDLSPLRTRLQAITDALKAEISGFRPSTLLAEPLAAFAGAKAAIAGFDPLAAITDALNALRARVVSILAKLDLGKLLEQPIQLFATIIEALSRLDVDRLIGPILDQLDAIAAQVDAGLEDTFGAFKRLQNALPDRVGGTTVSASVSVG